MDLLIERQHIECVPEAKQSTGDHIDDPGDDLAHVKPVNPEQSQEEQQAPRDGVVDAIMVSLDVKNTGAMDGAEVVQVYVKDQESALERPEKELKAFQKQAAGEKPNRAGQRFAEVEAMGADEAENPKHVPDEHGVCRRGQCRSV